MKLFLDTSVLLSACGSEKGASERQEPGEPQFLRRFSWCVRNVLAVIHHDG